MIRHSCHIQTTRCFGNKEKGLTADHASMRSFLPFGSGDLDLGKRWRHMDVNTRLASPYDHLNPEKAAPPWGAVYIGDTLVQDRSGLPSLSSHLFFQAKQLE